MRINGIGSIFLGISAPDENGISTATNWFTFIFLPIIPFGRVKVRFLPHIGSGFSYQLISKEKLVLREVLKTYLFCWILFPLAIFGPAVLTIKQVWAKVGLPEIIHIPFGVVAVIWIFVCLWKLEDWHDSKFHPPK
jgi:hypothetical protein